MSLPWRCPGVQEQLCLDAACPAGDASEEPPPASPSSSARASGLVPRSGRDGRCQQRTRAREGWGCAGASKQPLRARGEAAAPPGGSDGRPSRPPGCTRAPGWPRRTTALRFPSQPQPLPGAGPLWAHPRLLLTQTHCCTAPSPPKLLLPCPRCSPLVHRSPGPPPSPPRAECLQQRLRVVEWRRPSPRLQGQEEGAWLRGSPSWCLRRRRGWRGAWQVTGGRVAGGSGVRARDEVHCR